jgi:general secretion pathway protein C
MARERRHDDATARRDTGVAHGTPVEIPVTVHRSWIVGALCVVVCASFAARAAAQVIEASYFAEPTAASPRTTVAPPPAVSPRGVEAKTLTDRNPFCSDCGPAPSAGDPTTVSEGVPATTRPLVLVATMRGPTSFATIRNTETGAQGAYTTGSRIPGAGAAEKITASYVWLRTETGLERVDLLTVAAAPPEATTPAPAPDAWADRVKKIDDSTYDVDRTLVRELMTANGKTPGVRVMPVMKDGKLRGIRVSQARKDSLATAIGLRTGDVIEAIDGKSLDTADAALEAMGSLERAPSVRVSLSRAGKPVELDYKLH